MSVTEAPERTWWGWGLVMEVQVPSERVVEYSIYMVEADIDDGDDGDDSADDDDGDESYE